MHCPVCYKVMRWDKEKESLVCQHCGIVHHEWLQNPTYCLNEIAKGQERRKLSHSINGFVDGKFWVIIPYVLYVSRSEMEQSDRTAIIFTLNITPFFGFVFMRKKADPEFVSEAGPR